MPVSPSSAAVVVLPSAGAGRLVRQSHRRWLSGSGPRVRTGEEDLLSALAAIGLPPPSSGLAALRLWGQTGERPDHWLAAADPVYLEPQRDRLSVHALDAEVPLSDLRPLFEHLQATVAEDRPYAFELVDGLAYFRSAEPVATATMSAAKVPGEVLGDAMVRGEGAAAHDALQSEVQMSLYDAEVNRRRSEAGLPPVNGLWFWGGGRAAESAPRALPDLYGDDPLFVGYWRSALSPVRAWPGSLSACLRASPGGFVAVTPRLDPDEAAAMLDRELASLRGMLLRRKLHRVTLLFRDHLRVEARWPHAWQFWRRRRSPLLEPHGEPR